MNMKKLVILVCFFSFYIGTSQNTALFNRATEQYNKGEYSKSIESYEKILENGEHSAELYFNLGNCHYKLNAIGPSIYYYEKALLLKPNDSEILNNLSYAQNMRLDAVEKMPKTELGQAYESLVNFLSFDQWSYVAILLISLFVLAYLAYFFLRYATHKRIAFTTGIFSLILGGICVLLAYLQYQDFKNDNPAIVFSKEIKVTSEPNANSEAVFTLHEGTKVNVLERFNNWNKVRIADGQTGWMLEENLRLLKNF